ncbi:fatty acid--CoA ligase family protein [Sutcliffiella rhizosphaerae]|uniref:Long-chain-fatty-acid--CoA ligase n=1 Tax=Sutcliffiella rhizosphaerae TaxID=2880967 RepID=A0ABN8ACL1_9BACI|nr:fatty acid--CoA ligase family protein [Sutcliffiella rhizosphaerae]CAG9622966.1 Long-chain-fatty-acid--CoA ligase [Sutcliffiella rhizosphaerae]
MNISSQLTLTARTTPMKEAYIFEGDIKTYAELDAAINAFASGLERIGINRGDHIGLVVGNSPFFVISLYGAARIGATVIPINPIYTPEEMSYILKDGDVKAIITLDLLIPHFEKLHSQLPNTEQYIICKTQDGTKKVAEYELDTFTIKPKMKSFTEVLSSGSISYEGPELRDDDVAVILYTSGTTGKPKGAMLTHKNLYRNAKDSADFLKMNDQDKVIATLPMFHVFCLTVALNAPLMNGATVIIVPKFSPQAVFDVVKRHDATVFAGVPTMYNFLLQSPAEKDALKTLRLCISGGASMPVALLKNFEQKFNVIISEGYGLSEASPVTCFNPLDKPRKPGSIGTSIVNVENKVVNELGEELPPGEVGELIVLGPNVMKGYYKMPEDTAATIRDGWLFTGDLAKMDEEGYFFIVDRKKDMILVGGFNVFPREVEEVLYSHKSVVEVAVIGVPDPEFGEAVKCFVVTNEPVKEQELIAFCTEKLAKYKIPSTIDFLEELPKNTTGKILRRALKEKLGV